jgi:hypothetical protein
VNEPAIVLHLESGRRQFHPGEILEGEYRVLNATLDELEAVELSVLWYTQGKGDEDLGVHLFTRFSAADGDHLDARQAGRFSTELPSSPLSYQGALVQIRWCVRLRVFLEGGQELFREEDFCLGTTPPARVVEA